MKPACVLGAAALLSGCASATRNPAKHYNDLAPTGVLRVGLLLSNQVLVTRDSNTAELHGVSITLGRKLAARIGTTFNAVGYPDPAALVKSFGGSEWDVAFIAYDSARAEAVDFSPPYMVVDNTYLVPAGSPLEHADSVDRPGIRIAVPDRSAPDLYLSRHLRSAKLVRVPGGGDAAMAATAAVHSPVRALQGAPDVAPTPGVADQGKVCSVPTSSRCCDAMSNCSVAGTVSTVERAPQVRRLHLRNGLFAD